MRILLLEDNIYDAELIERDINEALPNFVLMRVDNERDFVRELLAFCPDLILSDYDLPGFDGALALKIAVQHCPQTPFILVTGVLGESYAPELLKEGARGYVSKHRLHELVSTIKRVLALS